MRNARIRPEIRSIIIMGIFFYSMVISQVSISPTTLFLNDKSNSGTILVLNGTENDLEVSVEYMFGYSQSDEFGKLTMVYDDEEIANKYSANNWIKGFPQKFILQAGQRQTVRLIVRRPGNIEDGTYWTRIKTTSNDVSRIIEDRATEGVSAKIAFQFEQITSFYYKNGDVNTTMRIENSRISINESSLTIYSDFVRGGNSPFLGSMIANIKNESGKIVKDGISFVSVYFDGTRKLDIDKTDLAPGKYSAEISFISERADIPKEDIIQTETVTSIVEFELK
ncbi:MAG: hypothetical protein HQ509_12110 [Candidatus Marinimicrobia bacterium]|nr:hypothetical protein [Candidatus Neomarinimicrobiota bacterium]